MSSEKKIRFIEFVVGELLNDTEIKSLSPVQRPYVSFPWKTVFAVPFNTTIKYLHYSTPPWVGQFDSHIYHNYGISSSEIDMVELIWSRYKEELLEMLL